MARQRRPEQRLQRRYARPCAPLPRWATTTSGSSATAPRSSFFGAPQDLNQTKVVSGSYVAPFRDTQLERGSLGLQVGQQCRHRGRHQRARQGPFGRGQGHATPCRTPATWWHALSAGRGLQGQPGNHPVRRTPATRCRSSTRPSRCPMRACTQTETQPVRPEYRAGDPARAASSATAATGNSSTTSATRPRRASPCSRPTPTAATASRAAPSSRGG